MGFEIFGFVFIALISIFGSFLLFKKFYIIEIFNIICSFLSIIFVFKTYSNSQSIDYIYHLKLIDPYLGLSFAIDGMSKIFSIVIATLWFATNIYSSCYIRDHPNKKIFYIFVSFAIFNAFAISVSHDLLTSFCFYELLTISTIPLLMLGQDNKKSLKTYLFILMFTSIGIFLPGVIITYGNFDYANSIGHDFAVSPTLLVIIFLFGIGKMAMMPFHKWLPSAMIAPTPVSALLHAVAVVKSGIFIFLRVLVYVIGLEQLRQAQYSILANYIACTTIVLSSLIALKEIKIKKVLAYSTISQLGYMVMVATIYTPQAIRIALLHFIMHAFSKIILFYGAGAIKRIAGIDNINNLNGLFFRFPALVICFTIAAFSIIGLPLTFGMWSKFYILNQAMINGYYHIIVIMFISTILNIRYLGGMLIKMYYKTSKITDISVIHNMEYKWLVGPMVLCSIITVGLFFMIDKIMLILSFGF